MTKYFHPLVTTSFQLLTLLVILGIEQVRGLPILFLGLSLLWLEKRSPGQQVAWSVVLGLALASCYLISFAVGFAIIFGCNWLFINARSRLASQTTVLLLTSLVGAVLIGLVGQLILSWLLVVASSLSLLGLIGVSKVSLTHHIKRSHL